ncbi:MAG: endonuclease domain-containing protein [Pseudomonadota bacterium]
MARGEACSARSSSGWWWRDRWREALTLTLSQRERGRRWTDRCTLRRMSRTEISRYLRRRSTDAEKLLWRRLRDRQLGGAKFRRQHPMGPYIVDFYCSAARLVIELDGGQHALDAGRDTERDHWLQSRGCRVLRFWNNEVLGNLDGVLQRILETLDQEAEPSRCVPSPPGRGTG